MASGLLAGVNPVYGLYACMVGPIAGGLFSSTQLMVVATTSATALTAGQSLAWLPPEGRESAPFTLVLLVGAFQVLFGVLGFGRLTRFVSYSVMTGFVAGIAILTILSQLPTVTGTQPPGDTRVAQTISLLGNLGQVNRPTLSMAVLAVVLAVLLRRTMIGNLGNLVAIVLPSALVAVLGLDTVQIVRDVGDIPRGLPTPNLPSLDTVSLDVVSGALAVAVIALIQGAGVSQSVPNPDGSRRSMSRDFVAQGAANLASGLFRGLPVGASLSTTALTVLSGARSRWAAIFAGLWMAAIVAIFPGLVSSVAMPALGALLIVASAATIKPAEMFSIWNTGWPSRLVSVSTFLATLLLPIQVAVGSGVVLSALLHLFNSSTDVSVVELIERSDGRIEERSPRKRLASNSVTVLDIYGHLFYAGARTLDRLLPTPQESREPVVIIRLRGRTSVGATLIDVLAGYVDKLQAVDGRLYLTGVSADVFDQIVHTGKLRFSGPVRMYQATPILGESTRKAIADAETWLVSSGDEASTDEDARVGP